MNLVIDPTASLGLNQSKTDLVQVPKQFVDD